MRLTADYHTHTSDGGSHAKGGILANAEAARNAGLVEVAVTNHGYNHGIYAVKRSDYDRMRAEADAAQRATGVRVLLGIEANIVSTDGDLDLTDGDRERLDIILAGYHRIVKPQKRGMFPVHAGNLIRGLFKSAYYGASEQKKFVVRNTDIALKAIYGGGADVFVHPNSRFRVDIVAVARACAQTDTYFELNRKGLALTAKQLDAAAKTGVRFVIGSDAHDPADVGRADNVFELIKDLDVAAL
ncbi:MAG: PHP domain-containing protein, partial [Clostridiales bacterium]|nr:PHP domain-containing protein [Clostridiales bacterium]